MFKILKQVLDDIRQGENIDLYLIVVIALPLVVLNLLGIALPTSQPVILGVLTLLAVSTLANRRKLETVVQKINQSIDDVLLKEFPDSWKRDFETANEVWLIGISLARTITTYYPLMQDKLKAGAKIKVLIVSPVGLSHEILTQRVIRSVTPEYHRQVLNSSLTDLCKLKEIAPSNMEIRTIDFALPFGVLGVNLKSQEGVIYVEHYPYKAKVDVPKMVFRPQTKYWYEFYSEQIEALWQNSSEWKCN